MDAFDTVKGILVDRLGIDPAKVKPEARFKEDLKLDSLDLVDLLSEMEAAIDDTVSDQEAQQLQTVGQAVEFIERRLKAK